MTKIFEYFLAFRYRFVGGMLRWYLNLLGCKVGRNLKCLEFPTFRDIPKRNFTIGDNVVIGKGVVFEITQTGSFEIGDQVVLGDYVRFSSSAKIKMGNWSGIAECSTIRGSFHQMKRGEKYMKQVSDEMDIVIGDDVLISSNCQILMGAHIPDGVVIGTLSLVTRREKLHPYGIFVGSPVKHIRDRA